MRCNAPFHPPLPLQLEPEAATAGAPGDGGSGGGASEGAVLGQLAAARVFLSPNFEQASQSFIEDSSLPAAPPGKRDRVALALNRASLPPPPLRPCSSSAARSPQGSPPAWPSFWASQLWAPAAGPRLCCCRVLPRRRAASSRRPSSRPGARPGRAALAALVLAARLRQTGSTCKQTARAHPTQNPTLPHLPRLLEVAEKGQAAHRDAVTALCMGQHGAAQVLLLVGHASGAVKVWELKTQLGGERALRGCTPGLASSAVAASTRHWCCRALGHF